MPLELVVMELSDISFTTTVFSSLLFATVGLPFFVSCFIKSIKLCNLSFNFAVETSFNLLF